MYDNITVQCYNSAVYAIIMCLSVSVHLSLHPSIRLLQVSVLLKLLFVGSRKQCNTITQGL